MAVEIDRARARDRDRKIHRSIENLMAESPKKGSPYCYDRIQAWIANNKAGARAMYLSTRVRNTNLSLVESTWVLNMLTGVRVDRTELSILLSMPSHIRMAIQSYHDSARAHGMILTTKRDPSELIVTSGEVLAVAREQLGVIFNTEDPTDEVKFCIEILTKLLAPVLIPIRTQDQSEARGISNQFILCLLISLRSNNPQIFCDATTVGRHVWTLVAEMLRDDEKTITEDCSIIFSPGTIPISIYVPVSELVRV